LSPTDFGGGILTPNAQDIFVVKLAPSGSHLWSKAFGGANYDSATVVAVDASDHLYLTGQAQGTVDFGGGPLVANATAYLLELDANGNHVMSKVFTDSMGAATGRGLAVDGLGNLLVGGSYNGTIDFGGGPLVASGAVEDVFLAKLDPNGNHVWSQ